ncbi:restriction endonuclease subunit S [Campylobacter devanensis]|uniref:restriction endonuclease subunit S n=1 Tax=Campylobacter devanensis TaxID=3161138 RepID=UPI00112FAB71|nr:restriction endonuclease subunit S [Campylobacter sp. P0021]
MSNKNMEFKDSGIPWIGQIPKHWEVKKVKDGFYLKKDKALIENPVVLTLARSGIKVRDLENNEGQFAKSYFEYNPVDIDDILLNTMDLQSGANCNISKIKGVISPAYANLRYKNGFSPNFYNYYFKIQYWTFAFFAHGKGVSYENRWTLNNQTLMRFPLLVPPLNEQKKIAEFLDKKCEIIDKRLSNLERKIKSLKEYKKSLISECVTKGLNPQNIEFKDSGIPWIGQIPKHWEISKIKYCFNFSSGLNITKENLIESGIPVISYGQIHSKENTGTFIKDSFFRFISQDYLKNKKSLVNKGNFIFADTSEDLDGAGNSVFVDLDLTMFAGYHTIILKNKCNFEFSKFLSYLFQTDLWRSQIRLAVSGVKVFSITKKILANCEILVPPLNEQKKIAEFLDKKCEKIDRLNENYTKQITALKEYKKSLIYECVTGKKEI